ncbi:hypothetical protein GALMADRAFT_1247919 [Galerina marginata CBS 339.88]|uniref:Uncharacterized protein n=1 Tax=Galerina marginata (strain CBS 339.88) TaxID=685588 RepID=A0A067T977_GALM3|nr:hypothetical protein GALMADRAFT_1247919 [Galerina marginata CBS 339.88]
MSRHFLPSNHHHHSSPPSRHVPVRPPCHQPHLTWPKRRPGPFRVPLLSNEGCGPEMGGMRGNHQVSHENDRRRPTNPPRSTLQPFGTPRCLRHDNHTQRRPAPQDPHLPPRHSKKKPQEGG